jgi:hypothetical protein
MKSKNSFALLCTLLLLPTTILPLPKSIEKTKEMAKKHGVWLAGMAAGAAVFFAPEIIGSSSLHKEFGTCFNTFGRMADKEMLRNHPLAWPLTKWLVEREPLTGLGFTRARFLGALIILSAIGLGVYTIALFAQQNKLVSKESQT